MLVSPYMFDRSVETNKQKRKEEKMEIGKLSVIQKKILFSIEKELIKKDIMTQQKQILPLHKKQVEYKQEWMNKWENYTIFNLKNLESEKNNHAQTLYNYQEILVILRNEYEKDIDLSWLFTIVREAALFTPYTWLDTEPSLYKQKQYAKLTFTRQSKFLKELIRDSNTISPDYVDYFIKQNAMTLPLVLA